MTRFVSASVTFSTAYIVQFDQAGLVLNLTHAESGGRKWIKSGVEFFNDQPRLSVVCCDNWSDWSVAPVDSAVREAVHQGKETVTILFERDGTTLWVYHVDGQGSKVPLREIAWVFGDKGGEGWQVEVGAVVARPNKEVKGPLEATFHALDVKVE